MQSVPSACETVAKAAYGFAAQWYAAATPAAILKWFESKILVAFLIPKISPADKCTYLLALCINLQILEPHNRLVLSG